MNLAKGLSILFTFAENQILAMLVFSDFLKSILFISAVIFMVSFLLLTLLFVYSLFSSSPRCKVRLLEVFLVS